MIPKGQIKRTKRDAIIKDIGRGLSDDELALKYRLPIKNIEHITKKIRNDTRYTKS